MQIASLSLRRIDAVYSFRSTNAQLTSNGGTHAATVNISTQPGSLEMQHETTKMQQDSTGRARALLQDGFTGTLGEYSAQKGEQSMNEHIGDIVRRGNRLGQIHTGVTVADVAKEEFMSEHGMQLAKHDFIPKFKPRVFFTEPVSNIRYTPAEVKSKYEAPTKGFNYTPASFEGNVSRRADVEITYNPPPGRA